MISIHLKNKLKYDDANYECPKYNKEQNESSYTFTRFFKAINTYITIFSKLVRVRSVRRTYKLLASVVARKFELAFFVSIFVTTLKSTLNLNIINSNA